MNNKLEIIGLKGVPLVKPGDNISRLILDAIDSNKIELDNGDIILIAQTIISKSTGRIKNLNDIKPSDKALSLYNRITPRAMNRNFPVKSPEHIQAILNESKEIVKAGHVLITETNHGFVCANAGIDKSNIEGKDNIGLLPEDCDIEATRIRIVINKETSKNVGIIITDSFGRPFRLGAIGVALGISGLEPIIDKRGARDLFGHELQSTIIGQADNLAAAAQLIMGEADEGIPIVLIKGYKFEFVQNSSIKSILREKRVDLFRSEEPPDQFFNFLKKRRSYKHDFKSKEFGTEIIEQCIEIARWAPSAHNSQSWRYIILGKNERREHLINKMNEKLREDLKKDKMDEEYIKRKVRKTRNKFLRAPYLVLSCIDTNDLQIYSDQERNENEFLLGVQSVSASITYFLLSLEGIGLAGCWYCAPLFTKDIVRNVLNLPNNFVPISFITVGYPLKEPKAPIRKNLSEILFKVEK